MQCAHYLQFHPACWRRWPDNCPLCREEQAPIASRRSSPLLPSSAATVSSVPSSWRTWTVAYVVFLVLELSWVAVLMMAILTRLHDDATFVRVSLSTLAATIIGLLCLFAHAIDSPPPRRCCSNHLRRGYEVLTLFAVVGFSTCTLHAWLQPQSSWGGTEAAVRALFFGTGFVTCLQWVAHVAHATL